MEAIPLQTRTLYAELLDRLRARQASRGLKDLPGSFIDKTVKGRRYIYFQHSEPGGRTRQTYVGPFGERLAALLHRHRDERTDALREAAADERLCAQIRAGGTAAPDGATARVLGAFADAGVFAADAVLVGTHAFAALGTALGWRWDREAARTLDIDLASVQLAVENAPRANLPDALARLEMGFLPVPALDPRSPETSFKVRGDALRVDLVAPLVGRPHTKPVYIPALGAHAAPLPFLDYLIAEAMEAAVPSGSGILVRIPQPARFAVHKLIVAVERPRAEHAKAAKDLRQAAALAAVLDSEGLRGDVSLAVESFVSKGRGWAGRFRSGLARLAKAHPEAARHFEAGA
ncbi:MAG: hypothetical protein HYZ75_17460 [Elusimicrobia bacterium]|nr:hypothetical protein [Elusimicrobiota bacterium]